jgi:hypothetical protein
MRTPSSVCDVLVGDGTREGYADTVTDEGIIGEALIALSHAELKEMGLNSVGHRLTILKAVYETKVKQNVPIEPDHYVPLCEPVRCTGYMTAANCHQPPSSPRKMLRPRKTTSPGSYG